MSRFVVAFCLVPLFLCSVGCRICSTPHDYHISAHIERPYDYRGSNPMYRAGSIFGGGSHQMIRHAYHEGAYIDEEYADYYTNAGNYGVTTPVTLVRHTPDTGTFEPRPDTGRSLIGIPDSLPGGNNTFPSLTDPGGGIPPIQDLIDRQRSMLPAPMPINQQPNLNPGPPFGNRPIDTMPFSPSDIVPNGVLPGDEQLSPPNTIPTILETDLPITLEELRRLDPTIQDVQIISIEDIAPGSLIR